jgi:hypothetical protein
MTDEPHGDDISRRAYEAMRRLVGMLTRSKARDAPGFIVSHRYVMRRIAERDRRLESQKQTSTHGGALSIPKKPPAPSVRIKTKRQAADR